jgi:hypothetical protein
MGRFQPGNQVAVGNRGGGRPPKRLREITNADAAKVWRELRAIALKPSHPLHARHGVRALCTMATYIFPKPANAAAEGDGNGPQVTLFELLCGATESGESVPQLPAGDGDS